MRRYFDVDAYLQVLEQSSGISTCDPVPLPEIAENQNYLFISYSHRDYKKVYADLAVMYHAGVRFWYDRGLAAGKNWDAEVRTVIENPRCTGVLFFLSENLFLSRSANQEIDLVRGTGTQARKNYFCVNLSLGQPSRILRSILRLEDSVLDNAGLDMDRIAVLANAFSDKQTYLSFSDADHSKQLIEQISAQFNVVEPAAQGRGYLVRKESGEIIPITEDTFILGRNARKCHYCITGDSLVSTVHVCIGSDKNGSMVMDMGAINGTRVNGKKIPAMRPVLLRDGDEINLGNQVLVFHMQ